MLSQRSETGWLDWAASVVAPAGFELAFAFRGLYQGCCEGWIPELIPRFRELWLEK